MRRSVSLLVLAVTTMVAVAFVIPLGLLVRRQAHGRAVAEAQREARAVAAALAVAEALSDDSSAAVAEAVLALSAEESGTTIFLPDGTTVGADADFDGSVAAASTGVALTASDEGGVEVLIPVAGGEGTTVVRAFVSDEVLNRGVMSVWVILGILGLLLVAGAVVLADRLGRSTVAPVRQLAGAARALAGGDLEARVLPAGPAEVRTMGEAFNDLADRLDDLLAAERESVAELSHRLRTPLTALRLRAEGVADRSLREQLLLDVDRIGRQVDLIITEARRHPAENRRTSDLATIVRERFEFWRVLAAEQDRVSELSVPDGRITIALGPEDAADAVEALLENVFAHTPPGSAFRVSLDAGPDLVILRVEDGGGGFPDGFVPRRGASGSESTGLGLDIVGRAAARAGGSLSIGRSALGGASIEATFAPG